MGEEKFNQLRTTLITSAYKEIWDAKINTHEVSKKYAPMCIQLIVESMQIPKLINNRMEKRKEETGRDFVHPDFWDGDMIISLAEHFKATGGGNNAST